MCFVPTWVAMAIGYDWCPRAAVAVGGGWCPRVWRWKLDVACARMCGCGSWVCLMPTCVAMAVGCDWHPRLWRWQLGVVGCPPVAVAVGFGPCTRVWRRNYDVVGAHMCSSCRWIWLRPSCLAVAVGFVWYPCVWR